jgi:drug/metabolite transporter (DMT)-like permease
MDWYIIAFLSAIFSALAAIGQKKILFTMEALDFSLILSVVNGVIAFSLIPIITFEELSALSLLILYGKTILGAIAFLFIMLAIKNLEISGALPLMVLTPVFVALSAYIIIGESLSVSGISGLGLLLLGIYILETSRSASLLESFKIFKISKYKHYLVYAIILFTISSLLDKFLLKNYQLAPTSFLFFQQIFLAINFIIIFLVKGRELKPLLNSITPKLFFLILIISFFTIGYRYSLLEAMKIAPIALVLSIKRTSIFFATLIGGKIFSEHAIVKKSVATILMLIGVYLIITI